MPALLKDTAELVAPEPIGPVSHAPVFEVDVWVTEPLFVQVTVSPTLMLIGFGEKHPDAGGQLTICADEFAAQAAVGTSSSAANDRTPGFRRIRA